MPTEIGLISALLAKGKVVECAVGIFNNFKDYPTTGTDAGDVAIVLNHYNSTHILYTRDMLRVGTCPSGSSRANTQILENLFARGRRFKLQQKKVTFGDDPDTEDALADADALAQAEADADALAQAEVDAEADAEADARVQAEAEAEAERNHHMYDLDEADIEELDAIEQEIQDLDDLKRELEELEKDTLMPSDSDMDRDRDRNQDMDRNRDRYRYMDDIKDIILTMGSSVSNDDWLCSSNPQNSRNLL